MLVLKIYKPDGLDEISRIKNVAIDTKMGKIGIYPGHMRLLTVLGIGSIELELEHGVRIFAIAGGILKVENDTIEIFPNVIEENLNIDRKRAEEAKDRASNYLKQAKDANRQINISRAEKSFLKATNRLDLAKK